MRIPLPYPLPKAPDPPEVPKGYGRFVFVREFLIRRAPSITADPQSEVKAAFDLYDAMIAESNRRDGE